MDITKLAELVRNMTPAGPELYYPGGDGATFWNMVRSSEDYAADVAEITSEGKRLLAAPAEELTYSLFSLFYKQGSRLEYESVYFEKRRRLGTFAILSLLEPECERYEAALLDAVWSICGEVTWCLPAHLGNDESPRKAIDLFAAETGFTLAELRLLLGERLPSMLRAVIGEMVDERLFQPFLENGPYSWEEAEHNWSAVCAGSIGSAALLLLHEERDNERLARILEKTQRSMGFYLRGFGDDGACLEGLSYWNYGFGYFVYYSDLLSKRSGGKLDWFSEEKVRRIAGFQQKCFLGGNAVVNFSDALPHASVQLGLSRYLAAKYEEVQSPPVSLCADFREDHCSRWAPALRNLLWRGLAEDCADWDPGDFWLEDAGWLISRAETEAGTFGFAAKGGHNDEPHNHNDLGQFILAGGGDFFLSDLGCGEYTKDYFREARYVYDCNGSQGHSVPIIDGVLQSEGRGKAATILEQLISDAEIRLAVELSAAYICEGLESFTRSWVWRKTALLELEMQDVYRFASAPQRLTERFISLIKPVESETAGVLLLAFGSMGLELHYDFERLRTEVNEITFRNHFGEDTVYYALDFHLKKPEANTELEILFKFKFTNINIS
ncbi:heparinase II/III family protein [Paenibacillus vini]|uniref:heparinase II/III family protein n=1 Tax=Paenibacillus vini TaxID=1476024 RepID=UPI0025B71E2B|nr:heparinase II/III family protein [Paenibacillus vini]MDN4068075.1 heparinase II/III family protein [Paenibacillus vini]